jgi:hypothetical protein
MSTGFFYIKMNLLEWLLLAAATVLAFVPSFITGISAVLIFASVLVWQRRRALALLPQRSHIEMASK